MHHKDRILKFSFNVKYIYCKNPSTSVVFIFSARDRPLENYSRILSVRKFTLVDFCALSSTIHKNYILSFEKNKKNCSKSINVEAFRYRERRGLEKLHETKSVNYLISTLLTEVDPGWNQPSPKKLSFSVIPNFIRIVIRYTFKERTIISRDQTSVVISYYRVPTNKKNMGRFVKAKKQTLHENFKVIFK